jgi:hypothetical protein
MRKKMLLGIAVVAVLASILMPSFVTAQYTGITRLYIDPPIIYEPEMEIGTVFSVNVMLEYGENVWGFDMVVRYDPDVLQGVDIVPGPFLGKDTDPYLHPVNDTPVGWEVSNVTGDGHNKPQYGAWLDWEGSPPHDDYLADGSGCIAIITFEKVGDGCSKIELTEDTGITNKWGVYINPPGGGVMPPHAFYEHGLAWLTTDPAPELYIRRRGAHGASGVWPAWHAGTPDMYQQLFSRILNYGFKGAWVSAKIMVRSEMGGIEEYMTDELWVGPSPEKGTPTEATVSTEQFQPEIMGKYWVYGILYFRLDCMVDPMPYFLAEEFFGGESVSRDVSVGFNVKANI